MKRLASHRSYFTRLSTLTALLALAACAEPPPDSDRDADTAPSTPGANGSAANGNNNAAGSSGSSNGAGDSGSSRGSGSSGAGNDAGSGASSGLDSATAGPTPTGGSGCLLKPNKDGWIDVATNGAHVQGSVFTYVSKDSTIDPLTGATKPFTNAGDGKLCVTGQAAKVVGMDYAMYFGAGLAFDLCQASSSAPTKYSVGQCPLGKGLGGIRFKLSGTTIPSELRVQFHEVGREQSTYVPALPGANEALFANGKVIYDTMAPPVNVGNIDSIHFAIPTNELAATPFDFCVEQVELVMTTGSCTGSSSADAGTPGSADAGMGAMDAGASTADSGTSTADAGSSTGTCSKSGAWTTSEKFGSRNYGKYTVRNNFWNQGTPGAGAQTLWAGSERCWGVDSNHTDAVPKGTVKGYPDVQRGWGVGNPGFPNAQHGLALQVSQLNKAKVRWRMQAPTSGRTWALWDIYFHEDANPSKELAPVNLMIQQRIVDSDGWMQQDSAGWPKVTIAGVTFREKRETGRTVSSTRHRIQLYVDVVSGSVLGVDDMKLDLKAVIDHYVQQNLIRSSDYLTSIQAGFEIVSGGSYQTTEFWTAVQGEADGP